MILIAQHSAHHGWVFPKGLIGDHPSASSGHRETKSASAKGFGPLRQSDSEASETKEDAALREVEEETGVIGKIIKPLASVTYWYVFKKDPSTPSNTSGQAGSGQEKIKKTVYYFLMEYISGDIAKHDMEMENVEWVPIEEVESRLTYKSDRQVWNQAKKLI